MRKRGRPQAKYRCADGTEIIGLARQADGRWRISATGEVFFADEHHAIARCEAAMRATKPMIELPLGEPPDSQKKGLVPGGRAGAVHLPLVRSNYEWAVTATKAAGARKLRMRFRAGQPVVYTVPIGSAEFYCEVRRMLLEEPKLLALKTGVERVGWLDQLSKPKNSPTLESIGELYASKPGLSGNEAGRSRQFWREFCRANGVKTVRELTVEGVTTYERQTLERKLAPKSILHRFRKIRTVLAHAIKRGEGIEDCRRALDLTAMLEVKAPRTLDARPISPADFWAIYAKAEDAKDKIFTALMLTGLNLAMYGSEVGALRWDQVDLKTGYVAARRQKTDIPRIGVLWSEALAVIRRLPRDRETIFNTKVRNYTQYSVVDAWTKYRTAARVVDGVVFSHLRDAAYTIALTVSLEQARLLAGHRLPGASDAYVLRNPAMVSKACSAIRRQFFKG